MGVLMPIPVFPKYSIGEYGFVALVTDTEGNMLGLHSRI